MRTFIVLLATLFAGGVLTLGIVAAGWCLGLLTAFGKLPVAIVKGIDAAAEKALPKPTRKAWEDAGAKVDWLPVFSQDGTMTGFTPHFAFKEKPEPALLRKLPLPPGGFGLSAPSLADADLEAMGPGLVWLIAFSSEVTDAGLVHLKRAKLTVLMLGAPKVTDAGLKRLKGQTSLTTLLLIETNMTDQGMKHLSALTALKTLALDKSGIGDAGLDAIAGLPQLADLGLSGTKVTDRGLKGLARMKGLRSLRLSETEVTDEGVKRLEQALPKCVIQR